MPSVPAMVGFPAVNDRVTAADLYSPTWVPTGAFTAVMAGAAPIGVRVSLVGTSATRLPEASVEATLPGVIVATVYWPRAPT